MLAGQCALMKNIKNHCFQIFISVTIRIYMITLRKRKAMKKLLLIISSIFCLFTSSINAYTYTFVNRSKVNVWLWITYFAPLFCKGDKSGQLKPGQSYQISSGGCCLNIVKFSLDNNPSGTGGVLLDSMNCNPPGGWGGFCSGGTITITNIDGSQSACKVTDLASFYAGGSIGFINGKGQN